MTGDEPSLGGQTKSRSGNEPSIHRNRKQVTGLGKNQQAVMGWLYDQGKAVTWEALYRWYETMLSDRYDRRIIPFLNDFNEMLSGLSRRGLVVVWDQPSGEIVEKLWGDVWQARCIVRAVKPGHEVPEYEPVAEDWQREPCPECQCHVSRCPTCGNESKNRRRRDGWHRWGRDNRS